MDTRNLELKKRKEDTRNKVIPQIIRFELDEIKKHFDDSVSAIRDMFLIAERLLSENNEKQAKDVMRSQIVFLVGAFDFFMHEITKLGLGKIFEGEWEETEKYNNISIPLSVLNTALKAGEDTTWFIEYVNSLYSSVTIVSFQSVKEQMNLLGLDIQTLADNLYYDIHSRVKTIDKLKDRLNALFHRRNIIAHQSDRRHDNAEELDIDNSTVTEYIENIDNMVEAICKQIASK